MTHLEAFTWVLERDVFPDAHAGLRAAALAASHDVVPWQDDWLTNDRWPRLPGQTVVFHGSLGNAAQIADRFPWRPGAFCRTSAFYCSAWYPQAMEWLLHRKWTVTSAAELAANPEKALAPLGSPATVFVRPDSPLKPFSGRVLPQEGISLRALDHGFYYDDEHLPVIVAPVRTITREWRYVAASARVVAGSRYNAEGRQALPDDPTDGPWRFASRIVERLTAPEEVYVLDVCEADGSLHLLELNPFSGADLYACDRRAIVDAISGVASRARATENELGG
jgi:ATP-grasp domain-containing protein